MESGSAGTGTKVGCGLGLRLLGAREERDLSHEWAGALGVGFQLYFLDVPLNQLWQRIEAGNENLPPGNLRYLTG